MEQDPGHQHGTTRTERTRSTRRATREMNELPENVMPACSWYATRSMPTNVCKQNPSNHEFDTATTAQNRQTRESFPHLIPW